MLAALTVEDGGLIVAAITLLVLVYTTVMKGTKEHKASKIKAAADAKAIESREKLALEQIADMARESVTILKGGGPPTWDGHVADGLVTVVLGMRTDIDELKATVGEHGEILRTLQPNGGNTNNSGDLIYKVAKEMGVTEDEISDH